MRTNSRDVIMHNTRKKWASHVKKVVIVDPEMVPNKYGSFDMAIHRQQGARISLNVMPEGQSELILNMTGSDDEPTIVNRHFPLLGHNVLFHSIKQDGSGPTITTYPFIGSEEIEDLLSQYPSLECLLHDPELLFVAILPSSIFPGFEQPPVIIKFDNKEECMDFRKYVNYHDLLRKNGRIPRTKRSDSSHSSAKRKKAEADVAPLRRYSVADPNRIRPTPLVTTRGKGKDNIEFNNSENSSGQRNRESKKDNKSYSYCFDVCLKNEIGEHEKYRPTYIHVDYDANNNLTAQVSHAYADSIVMKDTSLYPQTTDARYLAPGVGSNTRSHINNLHSHRRYSLNGPTVNEESTTPRTGNYHNSGNQTSHRRGTYLASPRDVYKDSMFKYDGGTRRLPIMGQFFQSESYTRVPATRGVQ